MKPEGDDRILLNLGEVMWVKLQISLQKSYIYKSNFPHPQIIAEF